MSVSGRRTRSRSSRQSSPPDYAGIVCIVSGSGLDLVMDVMLFGEKRGLRMAPPLLKPFDFDDLCNLLTSADDLLARRAISMAARHIESEVPETTNLRLREALQQGLLEIWYQPKYEAATGLLSGAEALIRARPPNGTVVHPNSLLRGAEPTDLVALTDFVLAGAVEHTALLAAAGWRGQLSVNIPVSYLLKCDAPRLLRNQASKANWPGMIFEITEDEALGEDGDIVFMASQLRLYSVSLSIDDFGAGYSSLARLRDLPFRELKLDRSFVQGCATDSVKQTICRNVLALGAELGVTTVAEGVETEAELRLCVDWGCNQVQGFLMAKPMPFADLLRLVQAASLELERPLLETRKKARPKRSAEPV